MTNTENVLTALRTRNYYADAELLAAAELGDAVLAVVTYGPTSPNGWRARCTVDETGRISSAPQGEGAILVAKLDKYLAISAADAAILPSLTQLIRNSPAGEVLVQQEAPKVGQVAYVWAMGYARRGIVTKVTRTKAEVAYTTASSGGRVFRKLDKALVPAVGAA